MDKDKDYKSALEKSDLKVSPQKVSRDQWKQILTPEQFNITRNAATEKPFSSKYCKVNEDGMYTCVCCGATLFNASTKFDSNCGWPSFFDAEESSVITRNDFSNNMVRTEVLCKACHAHLGHLFSDGPKPSGMRYCINGIALNFKPSSETQASAAADDDQSKN